MIMGDCCLNDPGVLARWLDGTLDPSRVRDVDGHLLSGCAVCWGVLRFVGRLRELVGRAESPRGTRRTPHVILDSEAIRTAIGIPPETTTHREILVEIGPWEALLELTECAGSIHRRLDMLAIDRRPSAPPPEPLALEVYRRADLLARAATDPDGRLTIPLLSPGALRFEFRGPGLDGAPARLDV